MFSNYKKREHITSLLYIFIMLKAYAFFHFENFIFFAPCSHCRRSCTATASQLTILSPNLCAFCYGVGIDKSPAKTPTFLIYGFIFGLKKKQEEYSSCFFNAQLMLICLLQIFLIVCKANISRAKHISSSVRNISSCRRQHIAHNAVMPFYLFNRTSFSYFFTSSNQRASEATPHS